MASNSSPLFADDFVMLDARQIHDLPLRRRQPVHEAEHESDSDDDLDHVSGPGSVRSLNTPSPIPSPTSLPVAKEHTVPVSPALQSSISKFQEALSKQYQDTPEDRKRYQLELQSYVAVETRKHYQDELQSQAAEARKRCQERLKSQAASAVVSSSLPKCHNHATIDQQIIDLLIEHVLTTRIEQEYGRDRATDQKLRQQMLTRFRSLPVDHSIIQDSMSRTRGRKVLFQGQPRSPRDIEDIYRTVFTNVERMALNFLTECHMRHFEKECSFYGPFMPTDRESLHHAMLQQGSGQGKSLALSIHSTVMERLDMDPFKGPFDDLRQQTRLRVDSITNTKAARVTVRPIRHRLATIRQIFQTTLTNLPNDRYAPDDSVNFYDPSSSVVLKRESPKDEQDQACLSPPPKRAQPDFGNLNSDGFNRSNCTLDDEGTRIVSSENDDRSVCKRLLFLFNGADRAWSVTDQAYDYATNLVFRDINTKLERLYEASRDTERKFSSVNVRKYGDCPYIVQFILLERQQLRRMAMSDVNIYHPLGRLLPAKLPTASHPLFQPVGNLHWILRELRYDTNHALPTTHEQAWLSEHARCCMTMTSPAKKDEFVRKMMQDPEVAQHVSRSGINDVEYVFIMDSLILLRSMQLAHVHCHLDEIKSVTSEQSETTATESKPTQSKMQPAIMPVESIKPNTTQAATAKGRTQQSSVKNRDRQSTTRVSPREEYQLQLMLLEQQNVKRRLGCRAEAKRDEQQEGRSARPTTKPFDGPAEVTQIENKSDKHSSATFDHFEKSETPVAENQTREYRRDTLLAASTQLPPPLESGNVKLPMDDYVQKDQTRGKDKASTLPNVIHNQASRFSIDPDRSDPLSAVVEHDYQQQLMELERQNRRRFMLKRQAEQERKGTPLSAPAITVSNGITYIGFQYSQSGMNMEYVIRADIESVDTNSLSTTFKDDNCLHASCEGWKSTAERIRESQKEHWRSLKSRMDVIDRSTQEEEPGPILRWKQKENNVAWSLAELNPCLRSRATDDLLRTAVKHYMTLKDGLPHPPQELSKQTIQVQERPNPTQTQFIVQSPDEIIKDPDLEESSSSSSEDEDEDDDDCCRDESVKTIIEDDAEETCDRVPLPRILLGAGERYLMFWTGSMTGKPQTYYTIQADTEKVRLHACLRSFREENCVCHRIWRERSDGKVHDDDCEIAMKLAYLNPTLQGKENEELRYMATMQHALLTGVAWRTDRTFQLGHDKIINWEMPDWDVPEAFASYKQLPSPSSLMAQCRYCEMILERSHRVNRVVHMACCDGYHRSLAMAKRIAET